MAKLLSPVYYTAARYSDFYWVSSPGAQHSLNLAERPDAEIVIFDSSVPAGAGEAVYITATAAAPTPASRPTPLRPASSPVARDRAAAGQSGCPGSPAATTACQRAAIHCR
jgi:hypothetical protein